MRKLVSKTTLVLFSLVLLFSFVLPGVVLAEPEKFKAVAFLPVNNANVHGLELFIEKINEKFKDVIEIELLGGPEIIPPFQLHEAVKNGVVDMALTSCGYYPSLLWEAQSAMYSNKDHQEIASTDYYDIMESLHKEAGLVWLGQGTLNIYFYLYMNTKIQSISDLKGKKIRTFPPLIPLMKTIGAVPVNLSMGDIYTAMERGAVDGFIMTHMGFVNDFSWHEVTKYVLSYPIYQGVAVILANQDKWNKLPKEVQEAIFEYKRSTIDFEISEYYNKLSSESWDTLMKSGVELLEIPPSEGEAFQKTAYDAAWEHISEKSPELGPKLKEMLVK